MDLMEFYKGNVFDAYKFMGAHVTNKGTLFRVYAPRAYKVSLIGEFNGWIPQEMNRACDGKFFELFVDSAKEGMQYKYRIYRDENNFTDHADPYGFGMELRPKSASIIRSLNNYKFKDSKWMKQRTDFKDKPLNIYEIHFGSWKTKNGQFYKYNELYELIIPYLLDQGYNCLEIMPLSEHPSDNSWGYQTTGFYSPTSRYGTMDELKEFVDKCHQAGIAVILDFVPVHFAVDDYSLANFDGYPLYEYEDAETANTEWGSKYFNHAKGEVRSFLQSNANYWIEEFHFDGLRMDAISNIVYWKGNVNRGENAGAVQFIKHMNANLKYMHPSIMLIAEDSTAYPGVTKSVIDGGLGFDYKWDMGWMNDTLKFFTINPNDRHWDYHKLTFSMMYYYSEKFLMPLSHDEVVHGKATIIQKMYGLYDYKFPQARALYMYMYAHPGKKLNYMGNEFAQFREWDEKREQDWFMLQYPIHDAFNRFIKELNHLYLKYKCFSKYDYDYQGFHAIDFDQNEKVIYLFERIADDEKIICMFNFSCYEQTYFYKTDIKKIKLLLASDNEIYGGDKKYRRKTKNNKKGGFEFVMSPQSAYFYIVENESEIKKPVRKTSVSKTSKETK